MEKVNPARGDIAVTVAGESFVLRATLENAAALQAELNVIGLGAVVQMLAALDARAVIAGLKCLSVSGDFDKIKSEISLAEALGGDVPTKLIDALSAGLPETETGEPSSGNA